MDGLCSDTGKIVLEQDQTIACPKAQPVAVVGADGDTMICRYISALKHAINYAADTTTRIQGLSDQEHTRETRSSSCSQVCISVTRARLRRRGVPIRIQAAIGISLCRVAVIMALRARRTRMSSAAGRWPGAHAVLQSNALAARLATQLRAGVNKAATSYSQTL